MKTYKIIIKGMLCLLVFQGCQKKVMFEGIVLSRHMIPMPGVTVYIPIGHGEQKSNAGILSGTTDKDGKFKISDKICNNCWGYEVDVHTADSGFAEHQDIGYAKDIQIVLK